MRGLALPTLTDTRGVTVPELLVAMTMALVVLAGAVPVFTMNRRGLEQHTTVRDVQMEFHTSTEQVLRLVRNASGVAEGGTSNRVVVQGGDAMQVCGAPACAIQVLEAGLVVSSDMGGQGFDRVLARHATSLVLAYGMDNDDNGVVDQFVDAVPAGRADDVLALRMTLGIESTRGRASFETGGEIVTVLRPRVLSRVNISTGGGS